MDATAQFWKWFKDNNKPYTFLNSVEENVREQLLDTFLEQLRNYCDKIYFEIGSSSDGDQELIITAEGDQTYFDKVEQLISNAPKMEGWTFIAFKPAMPDLCKSMWGDLELDARNMWFLPLSNGKTDGLGIRVCFSNQDLLKDNKKNESRISQT